MPADLRKIVSYLDEVLKVSEIEDSSCNGLQVQGVEKVRKVGLAVDACMAVYQKAAAADCQMLIIHHGLIWGGIKSVTDRAYRHVRYLIENDLNLYVAHLPLDLHPKLGNNIRLAQLLKLKDIKPFGVYKGVTIGFEGVLGRAMSVTQINDQLQKVLGGESIILSFGREKNRRVAIVSGGGAEELEQAIAAGVDCYITGEPSHANHHYALEGEINVIYLGHYHSEKLGVMAVGDALKKRFGVETVFLDEPTKI